MHSKYYKFFDTVIRVITPEPVADAEPYSQFLCDECKADFTVEYSFADSLPQIPADAVCGKDVTVFANDNSYYCWYKNHGAEDFYACRIFIGDSRKVILLSEYRNMLWNRVIFDLMGFEEITSVSRKAVVHASFIIKNGNAVLFTAPSGTGKSTQAALWEKYADAEIINGDKALVFVSGGVVYAGGLPFSGSSGICKNKAAPLCAIVCLSQAKENKLSRLSVPDATLFVLRGCYLPAENEEISENVIDTVGEVCGYVPAYKLECLPRESAVRILENELCL